jgi:hypothetical protein
VPSTILLPDGDESTASGMLCELTKGIAALGRQVRMLSIRVHHTASSHTLTIPAWYDGTYKSGIEKLLKKKTPRPVWKPTNMDISGGKEMKLQQQVENISSQFKRLQKFIYEVMPARYYNADNCTIIDMHYCGEYAICCRTDSTFCMNVAREHTSNHIYFMVTPYYIYQRCWSSDTDLEGRMHGPCRKYKSQGRALSKPLQKLLFPNVVTVTKSDAKVVPLIVEDQAEQGGTNDDGSNDLASSSMVRELLIDEQDEMSAGRRKNDYMSMKSPILSHCGDGVNNKRFRKRPPSDPRVLKLQYSCMVMENLQNRLFGKTATEKQFGASTHDLKKKTQQRGSLPPKRSAIEALADKYRNGHQPNSGAERRRNKKQRS